MPYIIERINKHIPENRRNHTGTVQLLTGLYRILSVADKRFRNKLNQAAALCPDCEMDPGRLKTDMIKEFARANFSPEEYVRFRFYEKSDKERSTYLSDTDVVRILKWGEGNNILPNNKYERYCMFRQYFHREVMRVHFPFNTEEGHAYQNFISNKQIIITKPIKGTQGHGVQKIESKDAADLNTLFTLVGEDCILEEEIRQGEALGKFHPSSVNTVRLVTGRGKDGRIDIIFALLRVGKGGSVVDNVGSGGLVSLIDAENGTVCTDAFCGTERFDKHPDTGVVFKGSKIPDWQILCDMGLEMHRTHPGQRVFGFDFAWTDKGWDTVEVNPAPSFASFQALLQKGCLPLLKEKKLI